MKEIVCFINLSAKEINIEMSFSLWLRTFTAHSIEYLENNNKSTLIRIAENINGSLDNSYLPINQFENFNDFPQVLDKINSQIIITNIDFKTNIVSYLKYCTSLFLIIEKENHINLSSKITETLTQINKEAKVNYIFLSSTKLQPKEFIFFNPNRIQNATHFTKNLNQVAFSKMLSRLNIQ